MANTMLGIIFAENPEAKMGELTQYRSLAAVPVGGRYRIIDFMLSNMVNSGISSVGVTTRYNYQSLMDHVGTGKPWDLNRKENGLFILPPYVTRDTVDRIMGGVDVLYGALGFLRKSMQEYALVADCNTICNMAFNDALEQHIESQADITLLYAVEPNIDPQELSQQIILDVDDSSRVTDIQVYPAVQKTDNSYLNMFIIKRTLLIELVEDCVAHGEHVISKDIFLKNLKKKNIMGYLHEGYFHRINSIQSCFSFNMSMLNKEKRGLLYDGKDPVFTKIKDSVPTKYGKDSEVKNCFIADGCMIEGTVKNSILFRGVHVNAGASIKNCVIMQDSVVMENCILENVILDKEVIIKENKKLMGQETFPVYIGKRIVV